ncbi:MAG: NAD(P)/FAD-dependent oxidoreductase [Acholeplasmataceae bacterium]|jgi:predicted Rossmann fold flavoprotein|nr:NAD(P)/FAD-dependent oxidoreductase [Acholeplasmataceae bacterium]
MQKVIVIGGGASGLMAALSAKEQKADVLILERNHRLGKKILATGNGRCNFTNVDATPHHYNHPFFVKPVFEQMSPKKTLQFFESLGIVPKIEEAGKAYPLSEQASSIVDVLTHEITVKNIPVIYDAKVTSLTKNDLFHIKLEDGRSFESECIVLATGGMALPKSGSDGIGYQLSAALGHEITPIFPALVKLELDSPYLKALDGTKFPGQVELIYQNESIQTEFGDVLFTKFGISGPTILQISRQANQLMQEGKTLWIKVVLVNGPTPQELHKRFRQLKDKTVEMSLIGLINKRLIHPLLKYASINPNVYMSNLDKDKYNELMKLLFDWRFKVIGSKDFDDAQVTAGGIDIQSVNPQTLESKKIPGLFFSGEILDIDGLCGGYNLQWAWSSGYVSGKYAAR